mgnify:FL=1|jgi:hypothetical protein
MQILSPEEVQVLTQRKRSQAQSEVLRYMGINHRNRPDGSVVVLDQDLMSNPTVQTRGFKINEA